MTMPESEQLFSAIIARDLEKVTRLLDAGAPIDARNQEGLSALMVAAKQPENHDIVKLLVERGADVLYTDSEGRTAVDHVFEPPEPPEHHENAYEAWIYCQEHFTLTFLAECEKEARRKK